MTHTWQHLQLGKGSHVTEVEAKGASQIYGLNHVRDLFYNDHAM